MKTGLLILTLWLSSAIVHGMAAVSENPIQKSEERVDTTQVIQRSFDEDEVNKLKNNPDFDYKQPPTVAENLWSRFVEILSQFFRNLIEGATSTHLGRIALYGVGLIALIFLIMMIMRVNAFRVFYTGADRGSMATALHENIHELDFQKLIREALAKKEYRLGIRLVFLQALKMLADGHVIDWQAGKTNCEYVNEISNQELKTDLNELSFYFDYAWYGNFQVSEEIFRKSEVALNDLKNKLGSNG